MRCRLLFLLALCSPTAALAQTCEERSSDYATRIALCDAAFAAAPDAETAAVALALKGEAQRLLGDLPAAAETLALALDYTPAYAWVWVELGHVRYDQGDRAGALAHYSAALAVEDYADAWANRAEVWWDFGMAQNCSDDADQALRLDAQYAYANEVKGRCLIDLGQAEQALAYFDTAIAIAPGYQNAWRNKLAALADLGRHEELVASADAALAPGAIENSNPAIEEDIRSRRLIALARYGSVDVVASEADALLARFPQNLAALDVKARALLANAKPEEADALTQPIRQPVEGQPMQAMQYDTLAQIDVALGRLDDAMANYQAALDTDPDLSRIYARKLSELGFLPLSNAPQGVLTALRRCLDIKKGACRIAA